MKKIFIAIAAFSLALSASARERSYAEKCQIAAGVIGVQSAQNNAKAAKAESLATLSEAENYTVIGYKNGGFAIVSNDDTRTPLIGYSTTDKFDATLPSVAWYLEMANTALKSAPARAAADIPEGCKPSVDEILTSKWDQRNSPYTDFCPIDLSSDTRCIAGCVATAMAQIMYSHKFPETGKGSATVKYNNMPYKTYFDIATYDWSSMLDSYKNVELTPVQKQAIARLTFHCGMAANMEYKKSASGAWLRDAAKGLQDNFGYQTKYFGYKTGDVEKQWASIIYRELSLGNPILYAGNTSTGLAHAFVLDGYDADGKVHVNWGYSGDANGYFDLSALTLKMNGQTLDYSNSNDMVIIRTPDADPIDYTLSTGIGSVSEDAADTNAQMYNLEGMKVNDNFKGVYIKNGKKHIAK